MWDKLRPLYALLLLPALLIEIQLAPDVPLRVDAGIHAIAVLLDPLAAGIVLALYLGVALVYGLDALIVPILLCSFFLALIFGRSLVKVLAPRPEMLGRLLAGLYWGLYAIFLVQWASGNALFGSLFKIGDANPAPYSILSSEVSFAMDMMFALAMALVAVGKPRQAVYAALSYPVLFLFSNAATVVQNMLVLGFAAVFILLTGRSRLPSFALYGLLLIVPPVLLVAFSGGALEVGEYFIYEHGSWRQAGNISAIVNAPIFPVDALDYRKVVGEWVFETGNRGWLGWFSSAFSWFPFAFSTLGWVGAGGVGLILLRVIAHGEPWPWRSELAFFACLAVALFSAPKWMTLFPIMLGIIAQDAIRRRKASVSHPAAEAADNVP